MRFLLLLTPPPRAIKGEVPVEGLTGRLANHTVHLSSPSPAMDATKMARTGGRRGDVQDEWHSSSPLPQAKLTRPATLSRRPSPAAWKPRIQPDKHAASVGTALASAGVALTMEVWLQAALTRLPECPADLAPPLGTPAGLPCAPQAVMPNPPL